MIGYTADLTWRRFLTSTSSATPTSTLNFLDGSSQLSSATLSSSGVATLSEMLSPGTNSITAADVGNSGFASLSSAPVTVSEPDYSVTANETSLTVTPGSNSSVSLKVTPVGGYNARSP